MSIFSSRRLTVARQRRGMTKKALSEAIDVSAQAITSYEAASLKPSEKVVNNIAYALSFPNTYFYQPDLDFSTTKAISFRARRSLTVDVRNRTLATGALATGIISPEFRRRFTFPAFDLPDLSGDDPESAARYLRDHWKLGLGPIHNMVQLLESKGIEVYWIHQEVSFMDAVSFWQNDRPFVVLNDHKLSGDRARFDAAHELGHLVLHQNCTVVEGYDIEKEADQFASAFLLPADQFRLESPRYPHLKDYFKLKERWKVSMAAMVRRGRDLQIFNDWHYESANKQLNLNGWRFEEPIPIKREESVLHKIAFDHLAKKNISPIDFAAKLHISITDLAEIVPVVKNFTPIEPMVIREVDCGEFSLKLVS